jgi:solute carrier family 40 (iron-regulated transporter), member 1
MFDKSPVGLNSQMRRIDLFCKLVAPLVVALIDGFSTRAAILFTLVLNVISVMVEYFAIARVNQSSFHTVNC